MAFKILMLFCLLSGTTFSYGQFNTKGNKTAIEVLDPVYNAYEAQLQLLINGDIVCTGECSPNPLLGLLRKNESNGWDTLVDINKLGQSLCGPGNYRWSQDTIGQQLFLDFRYIGVTKQLIHTSGIFKLTFLNHRKRGKKLECSNEFEVKITAPVKNNQQALIGFLDTTSIGQSSYPVFHYRVFSNNDFGNYFYVWHRIRYDGEGSNGQEYFFDKVFYYTVTSLTEANNLIFSVQDFNHDGSQDFRIRTRSGLLDNLISKEDVAGYSAYDYFLYDNAKRTFLFSEAFSHAFHISNDSASHKMTAHYYREVPLEGGHLYEAKYELPDMNLISSFRMERKAGGGGWDKIPVNVRECYPPVEITSAEVQQPQLYITHYDIPEITTDKKHYFPPDTVFLFSNTTGGLKDVSKLTFILEKKYAQDGKWYAIPNPYLDQKQKLAADCGFRIKAGDVLYLSNLEFSWLGLLSVGTYRISVLLNEKEYAYQELYQ